MWERRQHKRVMVDRRAEIVLADGAVLYGTACDISRTGMAVKTDRRVEPGTLLDVSFNLSFQDQIKTFTARCEAIYIGLIGDEEKFRLGLQFVEMGAEEQEMLNAFLLYRLGRI